MHCVLYNSVNLLSECVLVDCQEEMKQIPNIKHINS